MLKTNPDRLWDSIMHQAQFGRTAKDGVGRAALGEADGQARDCFVAWCREADLEIRYDRIGNIFARRPGTDPQAVPVLTGSHLDTQPLGGKFDGIYGVMAGLEIVRSLNDAGHVTRAPLEVVVWTDEEGWRFSPGMSGSSVFSGVMELEHGLAGVDAQGISVAEALDNIGYAGHQDPGSFAIDSFFEAHIEQGPLLESENIPVGIVLGAQGQRCFEVEVMGAEGHAGTLPMDLRQDALLGAARMVDGINAVAFEFEPRPVITVGRLDVRPNSRNTIPGYCRFSIDARHPDEQVLHAAEAKIRDQCRIQAERCGLQVEVVQASQSPTVSFDAACLEVLRDAAARLGIKYMDVFSGAGHDACNLSRAAPTAMLFVPCAKGISHNELESARREDLAAGCDVLLHAMLARAS